jgi:hypothetical protein
MLELKAIAMISSRAVKEFNRAKIWSVNLTKYYVWKKAKFKIQNVKIQLDNKVQKARLTKLALTKVQKPKIKAK